MNKKKITQKRRKRKNRQTDSERNLREHVKGEAQEKSPNCGDTRAVAEEEWRKL